MSFGLLLADCRAPTDILLEISTDADCADVTETAITAGALRELERRPFATSTTVCDARTGRIGTLALVPGSRTDAEVAVQVVTGFSKTAEECIRDDYKGGCIVARRALRYIPHQSLDLPIVMAASCRDVLCGATETCRDGRCVPAMLDNPTKCTDPLGCGMPPGSGGNGDSGAGSGGVGAGGESDGGESTDGGAAPICDAGECTSDCDLSGTFALKVTLRASWPEGEYIEGGSGTFQFFLRLTGTHRDDRLTGELTECGRRGPDYRSRTLEQTYQLTYPDPLFDAMPPLLPSVPALGTIESGSSGAQLSFSPMAFVLGTTLANPIDDPWPESARDLTSMDHDADGKPGITAGYREGATYEYPRSGPLFNSDRVEKPYIASRLVFSLDGALSSCTRSSGSATVKSLNMRMFGCNLASSLRDCDVDQAGFLDRNAVQYQPESATYELVQVAPDATCAQIRARF